MLHLSPLTSHPCCSLTLKGGIQPRHPEFLVEELVANRIADRILCLTKGRTPLAEIGGCILFLLATEAPNLLGPDQRPLIVLFSKDSSHEPECLRCPDVLKAFIPPPGQSVRIEDPTFPRLRPPVVTRTRIKRPAPPYSPPTTPLRARLAAQSVPPCSFLPLRAATTYSLHQI